MHPPGLYLTMGDPEPSPHHAAVKHSDDAATICGESTWVPHTGYYEFQWEPAVSKKTTNPNGTTGWARITHSTNPAITLVGLHRIHLCKFNPCRAWYPDSKYGAIGPPMHLQEVGFHGEPAAVAEPSGSHLPLPVAVETAVAAPPCEPPSVVAECAAIVPALALEQAPVDQPVSTECPVEEPVVHTDMVDAPGCPKEASLQNMKPLAPASPSRSMHVHSHCVPDAAADAKSAVATKHTIHVALLALARSIRRPRSYVGYSAFILMGFLKKCQPCVWGGQNLSI